MSMRLGKHPVKHDDRTLSLRRYLSPALPTPPAAAGYGEKITRWPMYSNDTLGDCTCAAAGHMVSLWGVLDKSKNVPTDAEVVALYNLVNGGKDDGAACLDVLKTWRAEGLNGDGPLAFTQVDPKNHDDVKLAIQMFSGLYIGLALPDSAQYQIGKLWMVVDGEVAGSWGGHCVNVIGYTSSWLTVVTWGRLQRMTWDFWDAYCDEAYALLPKSWNDVRKGMQPTGFNINLLKRDLSKLK